MMTPRRMNQDALARGFTLVELLVVIAIIGLLAAIVLASLNTARAKGRDARRVSDLKQLQLALELYYDSNASYPANLSGGSSNVLVTSGFISSIPSDPSGATAYSYFPYAVSAAPNTCISYHIGASLEANSSSLQSDADVALGSAVQGGIITGQEQDIGSTQGLIKCGAAGAPSLDFHGSDQVKCANTDAGNYCYDQTP